VSLRSFSGSDSSLQQRLHLSEIGREANPDPEGRTQMLRAIHERAALRGDTTRLLKDLGPSVDAIAARLEASGITGEPGSLTSCVVARYLNAVMGPDPRIRRIIVTREYVTISSKRFWMPCVVLPVPQQVFFFKCNCDHREFRGLLAAECQTSRKSDAESIFEGNRGGH